MHSHSNQRLPSSFSSCILLLILVQATTLPEEAGAQSLADPDLHAAIIELAKANNNSPDGMAFKKRFVEIIQQLPSLALQQEMSSNDSGPQQVKVRP
jgi:hypothetical protein